VIDRYANRPPILVTGSARLEVFRRSDDALTGRTFHYRLHPIDLAESKSFHPDLGVRTRLDRLLATGGFPEAYLHPSDAGRLLNDRLDFVLREDLRDLSRTNALRSLELLIDLLRERVGRQVNYSHLAQDLSVSGPTVKNWIELLERLYVVFLVPPYYKDLARSIRKEPKIYFYDCSAPFEDGGYRLENLVACGLLKYCHFYHDTKGAGLKLWYFRDRENHEVDFVVTEGARVKWCIEVKTDTDNLHPSLLYLSKKVHPEESFQLVRRLDQPKEIDGVRIVPLPEWLEGLFT